MSRIGRLPVKIPEGVAVKVESGTVIVAGPKGELSAPIRPEVEVKIEDDQLVVGRKTKTRQAVALHGLTRSLIANMVRGVTDGWSKTLELHGTGYRANLEGDKLVFSLGFSHPVEYQKPEGIEFQVEDNDKVIISGPDRQKVGQVAAEIRALRKPEPYKGKGIRYQGEQVRRKPGKAGKVGAGGAPGAGGAGP